MSNKSLGRRAREIGGGLALGIFAVGAHAEPFSLQGTCHVISLATPGSHCQLSYFLNDDFANPTGIRKGQIRIDGAVVAQYVNDNVNPTDFVTSVSGSTQVACGATYTVTAFIARLPVASVYERVGSLPPVACPAAP